MTLPSALEQPEQPEQAFLSLSHGRPLLSEHRPLVEIVIVRLFPARPRVLAAHLLLHATLGHLPTPLLAALRAFFASLLRPQLCLLAPREVARRLRDRTRQRNRPLRSE